MTSKAREWITLALYITISLGVTVAILVAIETFVTLQLRQPNKERSEEIRRLREKISDTMENREQKVSDAVDRMMAQRPIQVWHLDGTTTFISPEEYERKYGGHNGN